MKTRTHRIEIKSDIEFEGQATTKAYREILVADVRCLLIVTEDLPSESAIGQLVKTPTFGLKMWTKLDQAGYTTITESTRVIKPIIISDVEKIYREDWYWNYSSKQLLQCDDSIDPNQNSSNPNNRKVIALTHYFSTDTLQQIVNNVMFITNEDYEKGSACLIECEWRPPHNFVIKKDPYIKLYNATHPIYSREYVENITYLAMMYGIRSSPVALTECPLMHKRWFMENVKQ